MKNFYYFVFITIVFFSCSNGTTERYYRLNNEKYYNGRAELLLEGNNFEIKVFSDYYDQCIGKINGKLNKIITPSRPLEDYYYSVVENYSGDYSKRKESCIVIFLKKEYGIEIIFYGDSPNLKSGKYNGLYVTQNNIELHENNYSLLQEIFLEIYDPNKIIGLLGDNTKHFLEMFQTHKIVKKDNEIIIEGWEPGGNKYTNGIILIKEDHIYILFGDTRKSNDIEYHFYTDDKNIENIPIQIREWYHFPNDVNINRIK